MSDVVMTLILAYGLIGISVRGVYDDVITAAYDKADSAYKNQFGEEAPTWFKYLAGVFTVCMWPVVLIRILK